MKRLKVTIDRSKWSRGRPSSLANGMGEMCALGFVCTSLNIPKEHITGIGTPTTLANYFPQYKKRLGQNNLLVCRGNAAITSEAATSVISTNDSNNISEQEREERLIKLFDKLNIQLKFINSNVSKES